MTVLVRLKPYNKSRGHVLRSLTVYGMRFQERRGWYEVEPEVAKLLEGYKQPATGTMPADLCPPAFDIMSKKKALDYEEAERKAKEERAKAISPHRLSPTERVENAIGVLTTKDLPNLEQAEPPEDAPKSSPSASRKPRRR